MAGKSREGRRQKTGDRRARLLGRACSSAGSKAERRPADGAHSGSDFRASQGVRQARARLFLTRNSLPTDVRPPRSRAAGTEPMLERTDFKTWSDHVRLMPVAIVEPSVEL